MSDCLQLNNITKHYGSNEVLKGVDFVAQKGQLIVIKGKSGSGKSTLLNIIGQLDSYDSGEIYLEGKLIKNRFQRNMLRSNKIGFIFQAYHLLENLNVADNIQMPFLYSDVALPLNIRNDIHELLERFGIDKLMKKKVRNLSGGEKQRVAIARAMIRKPLILVADEPTGNLDPDNSKVVSSMLAEYAHKGNIVIVVTHSEDCFENADKSYRLEEGVLV